MRGRVSNMRMGLESDVIPPSLSPLPPSLTYQKCSIGGNRTGVPYERHTLYTNQASPTH